MPHSRPYPLFPMPPDGKAVSDLTFEFTNPIPTFILSMTYSPFDLLYTDAPSPYSLEFASFMACSSFYALNNVNIGPNNYSSYI